MIIFNSFFFLLFETRAGWNRRPTTHSALFSLHRIEPKRRWRFQPSSFLCAPYPGCTMQIWVTFSSSTDAQIAGTLSKPLYCGFRYVVVLLPLSNWRSSFVAYTVVHPVIRVHWHFFLLHFVCVCVKSSKHSAGMWEFINAPLMHSPHNNGTIFISPKLFCFVLLPFLAFLDCY
jgi:hypothetical protein